MAIDDDEDLQIERLRELGLLHLADQPEALKAELSRRVAERDRLVEDFLKDRERQRKGEVLPPPPPVTLKPGPAGPPRARIKSSTLLVLTKSRGPCRVCRHANLGTADFKEGRLYCWIDQQQKRLDQKCDLEQALPVTVPTGDPTTWRNYFYFEPHEGDNGTYGVGEDYRLMSEDADGKLQDAQRFQVKVIPGREL